MQISDFVSVDFLIQKLAKICQEAYTGCLYFVSSENRVGKFSLRQGEIVSIKYYLDSDKDAIRVIQQLDKVKYRLSDQSIPDISKSASLPNNEVILKMLGLEDNSLASDHGQFQTDLLTNEQTITNSQAISAVMKAKLQEEFISFVGPIASIICQQVFEESGDLATAIEKLASHISDPEEAGAFLQATKKL